VADEHHIVLLHAMPVNLVKVLGDGPAGLATIATDDGGQALADEIVLVENALVYVATTIFVASMTWAAVAFSSSPMASIFPYLTPTLA